MLGLIYVNKVGLGVEDENDGVVVSAHKLGTNMPSAAFVLQRIPARAAQVAARGEQEI